MLQLRLLQLLPAKRPEPDRGSAFVPVISLPQETPLAN